MFKDVCLPEGYYLLKGTLLLGRSMFSLGGVGGDDSDDENEWVLSNSHSLS